MSPEDSQHLDRAIDLARRAEGFTSPNPLVGCVILRHGAVVGEGWHAGPGTPHAEVAALASAGEDAQGATAYVSLEPCDHHGTTPPCTGALIRAGVSRVVIGAADPNPVAAGGAVSLRAAGIEVAFAQDALRARAEELIRPWVHSLQSDLPYTYLKWASTLDGRIATPAGESKWITGAEARKKSHELRQRVDAIVVGVGTILADDPALDPRPSGEVSAPMRKIVLDTHLRCPVGANAVSSPGHLVVCCGADAPDDCRAALTAAGVDVVELPTLRGKMDLTATLRWLAQTGAVSVMIEGGSALLGDAINRGIGDEAWVFLAPSIMGGGISALGGDGPATLANMPRLANVKTEMVGQDLWVRGHLMKEAA